MVQKVKRIPTSKLARVRKLGFNRTTLSGGEISRRVGRTYNAIRQDVFDLGLKPKDAEKVAKVFETWAKDLSKTAADLRTLAAKHS